MLASLRGNPTTLLRDAATAHKVNTDAIALNVKHEFAAKANAKEGGHASSQAKKAAYYH